MIYATRLIIMFILTQTTITFSDFPSMNNTTQMFTMAFIGQLFLNRVYTNLQYLCDHYDEYRIRLKMPEADTSDSNEGLMALKIIVVGKVVEHFDQVTHSVSPIRIEFIVKTAIGGSPKI